MSRSVPRSAVLLFLAAAFPATMQAQINLGGAARSATRALTVKYDTLVLELTPARLDAALRGFAIEADQAPKASATQQRQEAAYQEELRAWRQRDSTRHAHQEAAQLCMSAPAAAVSAQSQQTSQALQANANDPKVQARVRDLQARIQAAGQRQDVPTVMALTDTLRQVMGMGRVMQQSSSTQTQMAAAAQQCGGDKVQAEAREGMADPMPQPPASPRDSVFGAASAAGGFTVAQYAMVRERVLGFLAITPSQVGHGTTGYAFNPSEISALQSHRAQLTKYQMMLQTQ